MPDSPAYGEVSWKGRVASINLAFSRGDTRQYEIQTDIDIPLSAPFAGTTFLNQYGLDWSTFKRQFNQSKDKR